MALEHSGAPPLQPPPLFKDSPQVTAPASHSGALCGLGFLGERLNPLFSNLWRPASVEGGVGRSLSLRPSRLVPFHNKEKLLS